MKARVTVTTTVNIEGLTEFINTDPHLKTSLKQIADELMLLMVRESPAKTGRFVDGWNVKPFRTYYKIWNQDPFAFLVEYGCSKSPAYAPMRRVAVGSGYKFKENPKGESRVGEERYANRGVDEE